MKNVQCRGRGKTIFSILTILSLWNPLFRVSNVPHAFYSDHFLGVSVFNNKDFFSIHESGLPAKPFIFQTMKMQVYRRYVHSKIHMQYFERYLVLPSYIKSI